MKNLLEMQATTTMAHATKFSGITKGTGKIEEVICSAIKTMEAMAFTKFKFETSSVSAVRFAITQMKMLKKTLCLWPLVCLVEDMSGRAGVSEKFMKSVN